MALVVILIESMDGLVLGHRCHINQPAIVAVLKTKALFIDRLTVHRHLSGVVAQTGMAVHGCYE